MTQTQTEERVITDQGGDHDRFAHYIKKDHMEHAVFDGQEVEALCGKVWVPRRDPTKYPICPTCKEIWEKIPQ